MKDKRREKEADGQFIIRVPIVTVKKCIQALPYCSYLATECGKKCSGIELRQTGEEQDTLKGIVV